MSCCAVTNLDAGRPPVQSMRQLSLGASRQSWLAGAEDARGGGRRRTHVTFLTASAPLAASLPPLRPTLDLLPPQLKNFALSPHIKSA